MNDFLLAVRFINYKHIVVEWSFIMKKKFLLGLLMLSVLSFTTACGKNNKNNTSDKEISAESANPSAKSSTEPTNTPLPTADVSVEEGGDEKSTLNNDTAGYKISYDSKKLKIDNTGNSISFVPADKKDKKELNLFLNITEVDKAAAKELGTQLKTSYKKHIKKSDAVIGKSKTSTECYTITDNKKVTHKVYIISSDKKSWYIELKCPSKYKKKYMTSFEEILASMEF